MPHLLADDLVRHAVCLGTTGSGKTGLSISELEALAMSGVPILALDPKGDISNMALVPRQLTPAAFAPWTAEPDAACARWRAGLAETGRGDDALAAWHARVHVTVFTPGSEAGVPVDVLTALTTAPRCADDEELTEHVTGVVSALLALISRSCDPITDPAAILLCRLLRDAFAAGHDMPLDRLIPATVDPPFEQIGHLPVDTFLDRPARLELAKALNAVVASPTFATWRRGVPVDVGGWLAPVDGRTPIRVVYLAHLDEVQRMFISTLLLHAVVRWSRQLSGSSRLRALVYLDEAAGYLPPHPKNPPSKWPILTLLKQARAVGVGVMVTTQNPVDLDYKAMSNAGTWLIGRTQTRQDRARVTDGMRDAGLADDDLDLASLAPREFLLRDARGARRVRSDHTLSFLRGPLTRAELRRLAQPWSGAPADRADGLLPVPPPGPAEVPMRWLHTAALAKLGKPAPGDEVVWRPALYARWKVRFDDQGWEEERVVHRWQWPLDDAHGPPVAHAIDDAHLLRRAPPHGRYAALPGWVASTGRIRDAWLDAVLFEEAADGPDGVVRAERRGVQTAGFVVVWVPT